MSLKNNLKCFIFYEETVKSYHFKHTAKKKLFTLFHFLARYSRNTNQFLCTIFQEAERLRGEE